MAAKAIDLLGQQFGRLLVTEFAGHIKGRRYWYAECTCGNLVMQNTSHLRNGASQSCGCSRIKHGGSLNGKISIEYRAWLNIRMKHPHDEVWSSFTQFFKDVGWRPDDTYSLGRRDINQPHGPLNSYWRNTNETQRQRTELRLADEFCIDMSLIGDTDTIAGTSDKTREREAAAVH